MFTKALVKEHIDAMGWTKPEQAILNLREIYETVLYPKYEYDLITDMDLGFVDNVKVLGKVIMEDKVVLVDRSIAPPNRHPQFIFTMGHEFGHSVLHPGERETFRCTQPMIMQGQNNFLEFQANAFSENLLMPDYLVQYRFLYCYRPTRPFVYIGSRDYWFEAEGVSRRYSITSYTDFCTRLGSALCKYFCNTSKTSMGLKMHRLGLVKNRTAEEWGQQGMRFGNVMSKAFAGVR
ncbi:MAG: ImmA/IrrE family metallo-endopeptidase [candidate division Zixibacteria bacterium]|nr:ImmA/IrrE family metallo-endopeptidase [candidate division Zixibacteria bacterium]MDH4032605.1 ImmA/IrrE family metallo-endopeptidase [candidate division Zixibacteria bacterium]